MTGELIIACVRTGTKYPVEHVHRLRRIVARHLKQPHRFVCLTDDPDALPGYDTVGVSRDLPGWWAKMALFSSNWREGRRVIYFDLDTVIAGDLSPLADLDVPFGICASFTRAAGNRAWPCRYGSCVMTLAPGWGGFVWDGFRADQEMLMRVVHFYGDQLVIEWLERDATLLQDALPPKFFLGYRDLAAHPDAQPVGCSVVVFAGANKPDTCDIGWVRRAWTA